MFWYDLLLLSVGAVLGVLLARFYRKWRQKLWWKRRGPNHRSLGIEMVQPPYRHAEWDPGRLLDSTPPPRDTLYIVNDGGFAKIKMREKGRWVTWVSENPNNPIVWRNLDGVRASYGHEVWLSEKYNAWRARQVFVAKGLTK